MALGAVSINDLQLHILSSPDPVDCSVRQDPRAVINDFHLVYDVFCCAKFCWLEACGGWGLKPAARPNWLAFVDFVGKTDIVCVVHVVHSRMGRTNWKTNAIPSSRRQSIGSQVTQVILPSYVVFQSLLTPVTPPEVECCYECGHIASPYV